VGPAVGLLLFGVALAILYRELHEYHYGDVVADIGRLPRGRVWLAAALTAANYLVLTGYDWLGFRSIGNPLAYRRVALASFVSYVFSHNAGVSFLGGAAVRFHLYSGWGLSAADIGRVVGLNVLTFWIGFLALMGLGLLVEPPIPQASLGVPPLLVRAAGAACVVAVAAYLLLATLRKTPARWRGWELPAPSVPLALEQLAVSSLDWALAASVLWVLLPPAARPPFLGFVPLFFLAQVAGLASHIPAGLGVFEAVMLHVLAPLAPGSGVFGSLLVYRAIYYVAPLVAGAGLFGAHEMAQRRAGVRRIGRTVGRWMSGIVPQGLAATSFLGGTVLLAAGAMPPAHGRLGWVKDVVPLPVLEISHFLASVVGAGLLLLARGLQRRLDAAYVLTAAMLAAGAIVSLFKGFDYEEAIILSAMLAALLPCRRQFYRKASLLDQPFSLEWIVAILLVVLGVVWLLLFSYKHVEYSSDLWWQFELSGDAPRSLRATVGGLLLLVSYGGARLLRPAPPEPVPPTEEDLARVRAIVAQSRATPAHLALLGDKMFLFNDARTAFVMYAIEGRSWVALRDPVASGDDVRELAWRFRELSDRHGGWTVFYEVGPDHLPLYFDLGLSLVKLGEEAHVRLEPFGLEGGARRALRRAQHQVAREGCRLEIVPAPGVEPLLPELRAISDAWLAQKHTREKRFSLGFFSPEYLKLLPVAVVRRDGRTVAFANLLLGAEKEELSIDLMRYSPEAPSGLMDFLLVELMLWGKAQGYRRFNLGMAPFSGFEDRALAPLWSRLGAFLFRHGEHFYNLQGLRQYKEKFDPAWEPRYLASPGGLALPRILANVAALISGGMKGVVAR
jgi:phosphatidylglycerol lysyltransferase